MERAEREELPDICIAALTLLLHLQCVSVSDLKAGASILQIKRRKKTQVVLQEDELKQNSSMLSFKGS